ncbi:glycosyltransferase family 8 protein [Poriferisphaera corsica]|nr:glycosyltransferase family 8 protein [Poriferisphaera corsica]
MKVALATDSNYVQHACVAIASLILNLDSDASVHLYVLHGELSERAKSQIKSCERLGALTVEFIQVDDSEFSDWPLAVHLTTAAYYRLALADLLPQLERILYVDCDLIFRASISELWHLPIDDYYAAAAELSCALATEYDNMNMPEGIRFNSGVMLMNLKRIREHELLPKYKQALLAIGENIQACDQDILNYVMAGKIYFLDQTWNLTTIPYREDVQYKTETDEQLKLAMKDPCCVHYTGRRKPWNFERKRHAFWFDYWRYLKYTPFYWKYPVGLLQKVLTGRKYERNSTECRLFPR